MPLNMFGQDEDELDPSMTSISPMDNSAPMNTPQPPPMAAPPQAPPPLNPHVQDSIMKKFNLGPYSDEARQKLLDQNSGPDWGGALQQGLAGVAAAFQGRDSAAASNAVADRLKSQKKDQLAQFEQGRSNQIQNYQLGQQMTEDQRKNEKSDPDAEPSVAFRKAIEAASPSIAKAYGDKWQYVTAADKDLILHPAELKAKLDELAMKREDMRSTKKAAATDKEKQEYEKYVQHVEQQAASLRGDDAAKLSSAKLSAIASGRALLDQYKGREDEMTPDQLAILAADRVKAVTGQAPTNEEIKHMMPSNMGTTGASMKSYFTGKPEAAHSGGWVKEAVEDFKVQERSARDILKNRQAQITSNNRLHPEDKDRISKMAVPPEVDSKEPRTIIKTQTNQKTGEKRIVYSDGSTELVQSKVAGQ